MTDEALLRLSEFTVSARAADVPWADVSLAAHRPTGRACVLLVWRAAVHRDERLARRVARDVDAARALRHPAVAQVQGRGTTPDGRWFVAHEYVAGPSVADVVDAEGRLTPGPFIRLARITTAALAAAHAAGIHHGYLTPDNVIVTSASEDGRSDVTVSGFGTAAGRAGTTGAFAPPMADRPYLSPERVAGAAPGVRSDLFSLASVLQFALDGSPPLVVRGGGDAVAGSGSLDDGDGAALWHRTVSGVLARARAAEPDRRHASVQAFQDELLAIIAAYGDAALAAPELRVLDSADEVGLLGAGRLGEPNGSDRLPTPESRYAEVLTDRRAAPRAAESSRAPSGVPPGAPPSTPRNAPPNAPPGARPTARPVDRFTTSALRPELEVARIAPPGTDPPVWRPGLDAGIAATASRIRRRRALRRRQTQRAVLTVAAAGVVAFAASYLGRRYADHRYADQRSAPPVPRGPLADLSVPSHSAPGRPAPAARTTPAAPTTTRAPTSTPVVARAATPSTGPTAATVAQTRTAPGAPPSDQIDRAPVVRLPAQEVGARTEHGPAAPRESAAPLVRQPALTLSQLILSLGVTPAAPPPTAGPLASGPLTSGPLASGFARAPTASGSATGEVIGSGSERSASARSAGALRRRDAEAVVGAYTRAIEARDLDALVRVYPAMTERERNAWRSFFRTTDGIHAQLTVTDARAAGEDVRCEVRGAYEFHTLRPRRSMRADASFVAMLERTADGWRMRSVR